MARRTILILPVLPILLTLAFSPALGAPPSVINYQAKVEVDGKPYDGTGHFKFAILDQSGDTVWSNDGTSVSGSEPAAAVTLTRLRTELDEARSALAERKAIDEAKALLMKKRGIDEPAAYAALRKAAMDSGRRIGDVADAIVTANRLMGDL